MLKMPDKMGYNAKTKAKQKTRRTIRRIKFRIASFLANCRNITREMFTKM